METTYRNLDSVFELLENDSKQVIVKVKADNPLAVARFPFVNGTWEYITVTKKDTHVLTVIRKDGSTFSFHWGLGGYTLIGESLKELQRNITRFLLDKGVNMGYYFT